MIKNKSVCAVLACAAVTVGAFPAFAGLPTIDAGNIAGTIGIVTQGATGIQQGIETIANGSNLNAIIGDAAGTLAKFNEKYGDDIQKGIKAAQDAQKRISEGLETYNKYQSEIAARKAEYDALMETVSGYTGGSSYEDGEYDGEDFEEEYVADYDGGYDADYDAESVSTLEAVDNGEMLVRTPDTELLVADRAEPAVDGISSAELPVAKPEVMARPAVIGGKIPAEKLQLQELKNVDSLAVSELPAERTLDKVESAGQAAVFEKAVEATPSITNETTGRKRFGTVRAPEALKIRKAVTQAETAKLERPSLSVAGKIGVAKKISAESLAKNAEVQAVTADVVENSAAPAASAQPASARKFRVSPSKAPVQKLEAVPAMKIERVSSSTVTYSSRMAFAAENEDNTKGVGYDSNGTFISPLAKRCGISIKDLLDAEKLKACTNKIVTENFAKNNFDAINSRKDCERMIYETVVALLAETTQSKYEASNYNETLDKQEEAGSGSVNTRDDSALIALSNEQTQILLNRMSMLISTQIILDSVKQLCAAPKDVLKEIKQDDNKTEATDGGK